MLDSVTKMLFCLTMLLLSYMCGETYGLSRRTWRKVNEIYEMLKDPEEENEESNATEDS